MKSYTPIDKRYNTKTRVYPNGLTKTTYCNTSIFKYPEDKIYFDVPSKKRKLTHSSNEGKHRADNLKRAKDKLFDLVYCNDWSYFVTVTFNPDEVDSFNVRSVMKKLNKWLDNFVQRKGLKYLLVPEYHKSGRIHCHLLTNDVFELVDSGKRSGGRKVYNIPAWKYGFSTAVPVSGEKLRLSCYITKYITKDSKPIFGRYYWSSRNIVRDPEIVLTNTDFNSLDLALDLNTYEINKAHLLFRFETNIGYTDA